MLLLLFQVCNWVHKNRHMHLLLHLPVQDVVISSRWWDTTLICICGISWTLAHFHQFQTNRLQKISACFWIQNLDSTVKIEETDVPSHHCQGRDLWERDMAMSVWCLPVLSTLQFPHGSGLHPAFCFPMVSLCKDQEL